MRFPKLHHAITELAACNDCPLIAKYPYEREYTAVQLRAANEAVVALEKMDCLDDFIDGEMDNDGWPIGIVRTPEREVLHEILSKAFDYTGSN